MNNDPVLEVFKIGDCSCTDWWKAFVRGVEALKYEKVRPEAVTHFVRNRGEDPWGDTIGGHAGWEVFFGGGIHDGVAVSKVRVIAG